MAAAKGGHMHIVSKLLATGVDVNLRDRYVGIHCCDRQPGQLPG